MKVRVMLMGNNYVSKVIAIAEAEVGYLEKKSNSNLDSKTGNAGYNNYTKYAKDFDSKYPNFYNGKKNGFAWCDIFVDWCFVKAYGVEEALKLLGQPKKSCGAGCSWSAGYYQKIPSFYRTPKVGDQIFFRDSTGTPYHTGLVYKVDSVYVYTIEGNTSSSAGVVANGGCVAKKKYKLNSSVIHGYGRPKYDAEPKKTTTTTSKGDNKVNVKLDVLQKGSKGEQVKALQRILYAMGYDLGSAGVDGDFGTMTNDAVCSYQEKNELKVDGIVGQNTWTKLLGA